MKYDRVQSPSIPEPADQSPSRPAIACTLRRAVVEIAGARARYRDKNVDAQSAGRVRWRDLLVDETGTIETEIRIGIATLARQQRQRELPPEKMVTEIKTLLVEAGIERLESFDSQSMMSDVVRWGIKAYYGR